MYIIYTVYNIQKTYVLVNSVYIYILETNVYMYIIYKFDIFIYIYIYLSALILTFQYFMNPQKGLQGAVPNEELGRASEPSPSTKKTRSPGGI